MKGRCVLLAGVVLLGACATEDSGVYPRREPGQSLAALMAVDGCDDLLGELQAQAIDAMTARLQENLELALEYGGGWYCWDEDTGYGGGGPNAPVPGSERADEYSETNTQEAGVDEADFVKNDGAYIYILADGRFQIIDAWPPEQAHVLSTFEIEGLPRKLFIHGDRAFIYSSLEVLPQPNNGDPWAYWGMPYDSGEGYDECTYGYQCDFTGDGRALKVTVLDISDVASPVLVRETEFTGSLVNARRVGDAVFSVVSFPQTALAGLRYWPEELGYCGGSGLTEEQIVAMFAALEAHNREMILASGITDWLPSIVDTRYFGGEPVVEEGLLDGCDGFYVSQQEDGASYLSLVSSDMTELGAIDVTTVVGRPGAVYASGGALYVAARHQQMYGSPWFWEGDGDEEATTVHKFDLVLDPPSTFYAGSGVVPGRVLNQFAMDEHAGYLRIATTTGHLPSPDVHSTVSVLGEYGGTLEIVGQLSGLAPTEDIRSVRFDGDRGFIVTFKKTDPLFALDLSDPTAPRVEGELHIPGFSTYMHLLDDDHLLAIGYDADDQGSFAWFQGLLLQVFDVADMTAPTLLHREVIGTRGSTSEAATNHLAFTYFRPRALLGLPIVVCEDSGGGGSYGQQMTFGGLMVYRVTVEGGFEYQGGLPHMSPETEYSPYSTCYNWWTDSNSYVQRSIFMDDYVFSVAANSIEVAHIDDLAAVLRSVPLTE